MLNFKAKAQGWLKKYQYRLSLAGIVLYNNWLLGVLINPHATLAGATISELSLPGQPAAILFRTLDVLAGVLFLLGARAVINIGEGRKLRLTLVTGISVLGISTILESFVPLNCSSALDKLCQQQEKLGLVSWQHNFHIFESVLSYGLMSLLPLAVFITIRSRTESYRLKQWSTLLMVFMVLWCVESAIKFSMDASSYGFEQRIFMIIFSLWYFQVIRAGHRL